MATTFGEGWSVQIVRLRKICRLAAQKVTNLLAHYQVNFLIFQS
jgi:hypothetical protein